MVDVPPTNIQVLRPSRKRVQAGDIFRVGLPEATYVFGRVIGAAMDTGPMGPGSYLIYVYAHRSRVHEPDLDRMATKDLLIPPLFINRLPWSRGYFEAVSHRPLSTDDVLPCHCFRSLNGTYLDETGAPLPHAIQPCGEWGLNSFRTFDDQLSDALGIPRVPD